MKSMLLNLTLLLCPLFLTSPAFAEPKTSKTISSREAFSVLMKDDYIRDYFTMLQQDMIPTRFDSKIRNFFRQEPNLGQLYQIYIENEDRSLGQFIDTAQTQMIRVRKVMGSDMARNLHKMVVELATAMGFPEEAIENVRVYVSEGSKNAFTVSASKNQIIIVFQSALLDSMPYHEIRAVVGHELGHIVLGHTTLSRMNIFMLNLLQSALTERSVPGAMANENLTELFKNRLCGNGCSLNHMTDAITKMGLSEEDVALKQAEMQLFMGLNQQPQIRNAVLIEYLTLILEVMDEYLATDDSMSAIKSFRNDLINSFQDPNHYVRPFPKEYFVQVITAMMNAISRSQETSSDRISNSAVPRDYLASAFIRLLGLDKFDTKNRSVLISAVKEQGEEILTTQDRTVLTRNIGTSHPSAVLRIYLMSQLPSYPAVLMANRFTKILSLNQYLLLEKGAAEFVAAQMSKTDSKDQQEAKAGVQKHLQEITSASDKAMTTSLDLLKHRTSGQKHPRLNNLIQYSLLLREQQLLQLKELEAKIAQVDKQDPAFIELLNKISMLTEVVMPKTASFVQKVITQISADPVAANNALKTARLAALNVAMSSKDISAIQKARADYSAVDPDPGNHWPANLESDLKVPDFIIPRTIKPAVVPLQKPKTPRISLLRNLRCESILRGSEHD